MHTILTSAGRLHHLQGDAVFEPYNVPTVREIAHSLAQINRFTGHCVRPYSVAEHSLLVADIVRDQAGAACGVTDAPLIQLELAALLHDAHESCTGDAASPIKRVLGDAWAQFEDAQQSALLQGYGVWDSFNMFYGGIKQADLIALATERRDLMPWTKHGSLPWDVLDIAGEEVEPWPHVRLNALPRRLAPWWWWRDRYVRRVEALESAIANHAQEAPALAAGLHGSSAQ